MSTPLVAVVMGSTSDWDTMQHTVDTLKKFDIPHEVKVLSAHRTPDEALAYASGAEENGIEVIIAAAGGAAHLAGVLAAKTVVPVLAVPMKSDALQGLDSLLSMVQMPAGIPVATLAIGKPGAVNAALYAASMLGNKHSEIRKKIHDFRTEQRQKVLNSKLPA